MKIYQVKAYLKYMRKPVCLAYFETKGSLDKWINEFIVLNINDTVRLGDVLFVKRDVKYVEIEEKSIKH